MVPLWFGRWAQELLNLVSLRPGESVLDVACGTGVTTRSAKNAVGPYGHVTGLDINAPMLALAAELAEDVDINWMEADVCKNQLEPDTYDAIISQHGYHYFPDKPRALAEFGRVLAPGGRLAFSVWDGHSAYTSALCTAVEKYISPEVAKKQRSQRETPNAAQLEQAVIDAGFDDVSVKTQTLEIRVPLASEFVPLHLGSMPIANAFLALSDVEKEKLIGTVENALSEHVRKDQLVYNDSVNVAMGFK